MILFYFILSIFAHFSLADENLPAAEVASDPVVCEKIPYDYLQEMNYFESLRREAEHTALPWPKSLVIALQKSAQRMTALAAPEFTSPSIATTVRWSLLKQDVVPTDIAWDELKMRVRGEGVRSLARDETALYFAGPMSRFRGIESVNADYIELPDAGQFKNLFFQQQKNIESDETDDRLNFTYRAVLSPVERCQLIRTLRFTVKIRYQYRIDQGYRDGSKTFHLETSSR